MMYFVSRDDHLLYDMNSADTVSSLHSSQSWSSWRQSCSCRHLHMQYWRWYRHM